MLDGLITKAIMLSLRELIKCQGKVVVELKAGYTVHKVEVTLTFIA